MKIILSTVNEIDVVLSIVQQTIQSVYPHYYPYGAVEFFSSHHMRSNILADIANYTVWVLQDNAVNAGTVTIKNNEVCRLFVLPDFHHRGYGRKLMDFAEQIVFKSYDNVVLDSSFPAQEMYEKRGYEIVRFNKILCDNGDYLCYYSMMLKKGCKTTLP